MILKNIIHTIKNSLFQKKHTKRGYNFFGRQKKKHIFLDQKKKQYTKRKHLRFGFNKCKRSHKSMKNKFIIPIYGFILLCISCIIFILFSSYFTVKNIIIIKEDSLSNIDIAYKSINTIRGKGIFSIKKEEILHKMQTYQQNIKDIHLKINFPDSIKITMKSYPGAFYTSVNNKTYIITTNGDLIPTQNTQDHYTHIEIIDKNNLKINTFVDYKNIYDTIYIIKIQEFIKKLKDNIINLDIQNIQYYINERELHIKTQHALLIYSLDSDITEQIKKSAVMHSQHNNINDSNIVYIDFRVNGKVFYCHINTKNICMKNLKNIYED